MNPSNSNHSMIPWFSGGLGSFRFTAGLNDLKGVLQPKSFCDSLILFLLAMVS